MIEFVKFNKSWKKFWGEIKLEEYLKRNLKKLISVIFSCTWNIIVSKLYSKKFKRIQSSSLKY